MEYELEYFAEFLDDPTKPEINEFFRMIDLWAKFIEAHRDEFNYLEDAEWEEIRERLLDDLYERIDIRDEIRAQWFKINRHCLSLPQNELFKFLELGKIRLDFMKKYPYILQIEQPEIDEAEELVNDLEKRLAEARFADEKLRFMRLHIDQTVAELDESLAKHYEKTGKIPVLPRYPGKKVYRGN